MECGKRTIDKYPESSVCMFSITNIEAINERLSRDKGTEIIIKLSNLVKSEISSEYVFVRYMGPKFAIVFSGVNVDGVVSFVTALKKSIEEIKVYKEEKQPKTKKKVYVSPRTNFVIGTYYKGTGLEEVTKKLEEYLDEADKKESNINCI